MNLILHDDIKAFDVYKETTFEFELDESTGLKIDWTEIEIYEESVSTNNLIAYHRQYQYGYNSYIHFLPSKDNPNMSYAEGGEAKYINGKKFIMRMVLHFNNVSKFLTSNIIELYSFETPVIEFAKPSFGDDITVYFPSYTVSIDASISYPYPAYLSVTNKIQKYLISVWDKDTGKFVCESGYILGTGTNVSNEIIGDRRVYKYNIQYTFDNLPPNINCRIEMDAYTENNMYIYSEGGKIKYSEGSIPFGFDSVTNEKDKGCIKLSGLYADAELDGIQEVIVQRKLIGDDNNPWISLGVKPYPLHGAEFLFDDITAEAGNTYIYRPMGVFEIDGTRMQRAGTESEPVKCCYDGVFVHDAESFIRLDTAIYTGMQVQQTVGVHNPLGSKYPIVVVNGKTNYHTGGVGGKILNDSFGKKNSDGTYNGFSEYEAVKRRKELDEFLTNKKPKILKDSFGNASIIMVTEAPTYEFEEWNGALASLNFNYTEIGDPSNPNDIIRMGLGGVD